MSSSGRGATLDLAAFFQTPSQYPMLDHSDASKEISLKRSSYFTAGVPCSLLDWCLTSLARHQSFLGRALQGSSCTLLPLSPFPGFTVCLHKLSSLA